MPDQIPFARPTIDEEDVAEVADTLRSGWITTGPRVHGFEEDFAAFVGADAALGVASCTAAMHCALLALGVGPGDEVVTTTMTFVSTVHVIEQTGATPILVDVDPRTLTIDPAAVERAVGEHDAVKAVMPVHLYGHPCDMNPLIELARARDISILEDAAHALGAKYHGRPIGAPLEGVRSATAFSFYATKNLTTGEGGMLTGSAELVAEARAWSLHGLSRDAWKRYSATGDWFYDVDRPGFKYNMTDLQAALGSSQLRRFGSMQARRKSIASRYLAGLEAVDMIELPTRAPGIEHAWHLFAIRLRADGLAITRAAFVEELKKRGIGTSVHFIPVHHHSYYRDRFDPSSFPVADEHYERLISLPLYPGLTDDDVDRVVDAVTDVAVKNRR